MARQKSHLLKLMKQPEKNLYETTIEDCRKWFDIINREIFDGCLDPIEDIDIRWRRGTHAYYEYYKCRCLPPRLRLNKKYKSKQYFVAVLAHEMVHHHQHLFGEPVGHGIYFSRWEKKFKQKGLTLA